MSGKPEQLRQLLHLYIASLVNMFMDIVQDMRYPCTVFCARVRQLMIRYLPDHGKQCLQQKENSVAAFLPLRRHQPDQRLHAVNTFRDHPFLPRLQQQLIQLLVPALLQPHITTAMQVYIGEFNKGKGSRRLHLKMMCIAGRQQKQTGTGIRNIHPRNTMRAAALMNKDQFKMIVVMHRVLPLTGSKVRHFQVFVLYISLHSLKYTNEPRRCTSNSKQQGLIFVLLKIQHSDGTA